MYPFLEQVFSLLDTDVGSLVYHLVLAFSVAGALQVSLSHHQLGHSVRLRRMLVGLTLMLAAQVSLFAVSGLVWQGVVDGGRWLPLLDRAVTLFHLLLIVWLWAFPDPAPTVDAGLFLLTLFAVAGGVMATLNWINQGTINDFNGSWLDLASQWAALTISSAGALLLLVRRPDGWGYGLSMLALAIAGHTFHLWQVPYQASYPFAVRLSQIAAYPFLLLLPQRSSAMTDSTGRSLAVGEQYLPAESKALGWSDLPADPDLWQALLRLATETDPQHACHAATNALASGMKADICLLLSPPDEAGNFVIQCGYDRHNQKTIERRVIESASLPMVHTAFRMGRTRRLALQASSPDMLNLARLLNLTHTGSLLFSPVLGAGSQPLAGVVFLAPYSSKDWSPQEQEFARLLSRLVVQILQRYQEMGTLKTEINLARQSHRLAQEQLNAVMEENHKIRHQMAVLQENAARDQQQLASMSAMIPEYALIQDRLVQLQSEYEAMQDELAALKELQTVRETPVEAELRLTLEEIAYLNEALSEADRRINELLMMPPPDPAVRQQISNVVHITEELRQPLASISGYTDVLLGESTGILGKNQRKFLERIKVSTERMGRLVDDLIQAATTEVSAARLDFRPVDLNSIIGEVVRTVNPQMRQKHIELSVEMPDQPVSIHTDEVALKKVLVQLLNNAGSVTPPDGVVNLAVRLQSTDGQVDFVLLQVIDGGGGIQAQDLPRVFLPHPGATIAGVSNNGVDMPSIKALVDAIGGRTWVDSEAGHGATFSVLLPVLPAESNLEKSA